MTSKTAAGQAEVLARNSLGLAHIVFFVVAAAAPLTAVVGATPVAFAFGNGPGVAGAFLLAGVMYLLFSVGFTAMSRHVRGAGAFYTYIVQGLGRPVGVGAAMIILLAYNAVQLGIYALFGVFVAAALEPLGIDLPWWVYSIAGIAIVTALGRRNIAFSGRVLGLCLVAEVLILLLLGVGILLRGGGPEGLSLDVFAPSTVFTAGLGATLVFVIGSYIGFEATAIFAEEAKEPRRTIPRATYAAVGLITVFYAFSTWAIAQYYGPSQVAAAAQSGLEEFYFTASADILGPWSVPTMSILLIVSLFACVLSFHNTISRYFFALGREGVLASALSRVHPLHRSPHVAGLAQSGLVGSVLLIMALAGLDPYGVIFSWMSVITVLGVLTVQALVSLAVIQFFRTLPAGERPGAFAALFAPALSALCLGGAVGLVISNIEFLSGTESPIVQTFPVLIAVVGIGGALFANWLRSNRPVLYARLGRALEQ